MTGHRLRERGVDIQHGATVWIWTPSSCSEDTACVNWATVQKLSYWSVQDKPLLKLPNPASLMVNTLTNYIVFWNNFKRSLLRLFLKIYQRMNLWIYNPTLDMLMWIISHKKKHHLVKTTLSPQSFFCWRGKVCLQTHPHISFSKW